MKQLKRGWLVKVTWKDAHLTMAEDHGPSINQNVGWVVRFNRKGVSLVDTKQQKDSNIVSAYSFIPKGAIKSIKVIER